MPPRRTPALRPSFFAAAAVALGLFAGCASGTSADDEGTLDDAGVGDAADEVTKFPGKSDAAAPGTFGATCSSAAQCTSGQCTAIGPKGTDKVCTVACTAGACPGGAYCAWVVGKGYQCLPDLGLLCAPCASDTSCGASDRCATAPLGDNYCSRDCSWDGVCPTGYACKTASGADAGPPPDAGGPSDASADGAGDAGIPKREDAWCTPVTDGACACGPKRDGVERNCSQKNAIGTCLGKEHCDGKSASWTGCSALTPAVESCDAVDNDCNGKKDDGTGDALCAKKKGAPPPHAHWACGSGACAFGACDPGWARYPTSTPEAAGCTCSAEVGEPNDACAKATPIASVSDVDPNPVVVTGSMGSDNDADWYQVDALDTPEGDADSFHFQVHFTAPAPNGTLRFDVFRAADCASATGGHAALSDYDWCVDFNLGSLGQAVCGRNGQPNDCIDDSQRWYLRVTRAPGAPLTCLSYTFAVSAHGVSSTPCGPDDKCDPQQP